MSCYMRHMNWLFEALDVPYDKEHRKHLDAAIRAELDIPAEARCPEVWAAIKALSDDERAALPGRLGA